MGTVEKEVGKVIQYVPSRLEAEVKLSGTLRVKDYIRIKGPRSDWIQLVELLHIDHKPISKGKSGQIFWLGVKMRAHKDDIVFKITYIVHDGDDNSGGDDNVAVGDNVSIGDKVIGDGNGDINDNIVDDDNNDNDDNDDNDGKSNGDKGNGGKGNGGKGSGGKGGGGKGSGGKGSGGGGGGSGGGGSGTPSGGSGEKGGGVGG